MTNKEYVSRRDALLQEQAPYIVMSKNELIAEGENFTKLEAYALRVPRTYTIAESKGLGFHHAKAKEWGWPMALTL